MVKLQTRRDVSALLFVVVSVIVMLYLGTWQVKRLFWKNALVQTIATNTSMEPLALDRCQDLQVQAQDLYRPVTLSGEFDYKHAFYLYAGAREMQGGQGYRMLTIFNCAKGGHILVDRGWVPLDYRQMPEKIYEPKGTMTLHGALLKGEQPGIFTPSNRPEHNMWYWIDLDSFAKVTSYSLPAVFFMEAPTERDGPVHIRFPLGKQVEASLRNNHLQYAITWYSLAIAAIVIYILALRNKRRTS